MSDITFTQIPLEEFRPVIAKVKRQVMLGLKRIAITEDGEPVAFWVPLSDFKSGKSIRKPTPITHFRAHLNGYIQRLKTSEDVFYLTYNGTLASAVVSARLANDLSVPVSEVAGKLAAIQAGPIPSVKG